jgi:hypothetical protein
VGTTEKPKQTFFCWVRVYDATKKVAPTPPPPPEKTVSRMAAQVVVGSGLINITGGGTPPPNHRVTTKIDPVSGKEQLIEGPIGSWSAVKGYYGREGDEPTFDFGPAFLSAEQAVEWIATDPEGMRWEREATNRFLMSFAYFAEGV